MLKRLGIVWNTRSIVFKIMAAFMLVVAPLCLSSIWITYQSSNRMQGEIERAHESKLQFYYSHLQFELQRITRLVTEYSVDNTLSTFSARIPIMSRSDIVLQLDSIQVKLKQMKETSPYIQDVVYYVPSIGKKISAIEGIAGVPEEEWINLLSSRGNLGGAFSKYNNGLYLLQSNPFYLDLETPPNFLLGVSLSSAELQRQLTEFAMSGESEIALDFGSRHDVIIASSESFDIAKLDQLLKDAGTEADVERLLTEKVSYYSIYDQENNFRITASIPNSVVTKPIQFYSIWLVLLTLLSVFVVVLFSVWTFRVIHRPMTVLIRAFKRAEQGDITVPINHYRKDEFGYLYERFNDMIKRLHTLIEENYVQRIRTSEVELKHLQSQITPHFLYNSLFSIKQMAEMDNVELIKKFSDYLGQYFRYITRDFAKEMTLGQELDHALVYLAIQEIRFGSRCRAEVEPIDPACRDILVPRVLLQPILENVFEHGLSNKARNGWLGISYGRENGTLMIHIEDNGEGLTDERLALLKEQLDGENEHTGEITGLINVHQRLRMKFGKAYGLHAGRSDKGGLRVSVYLPAGEDGQ